jgi:hypothetical protein
LFLRKLTLLTINKTIRKQENKMSYQNECAYLPSDLLDSDDDVAPVTTKATKSLNNSFSKLYDNNSDAKTADNSSNEGKNASTEFGSSIFSV